MFENMSIKNRVELLLVIVLLYNAVMTSCEVVLINRNVTDSFRVGEFGCKSDPNICTTRNATCLADGSCLCNEDSPNFRNPVIEESDGFGETYGCTENKYIRPRVDTTNSYLKPFQVIPYSPRDPPTKFTVEISSVKRLYHCYLVTGEAASQVKFPGNATEMYLQWLNKSHVNFTVSNKDLYFKWARSVACLQGAIITLKFSCKISENTRLKMRLVAKVLGSRSTDIFDPIAFSPDFTITTSANTTDVNQSDLIPPTRSSPSESLTSSSSLDKEYLILKVSSTFLIVVPAVSLVVVVFLGVIIRYRWKKRSRNTYEEPSYFEALRQNQLQDQSEKNRYQCLTVFPEINGSDHDYDLPSDYLAVDHEYEEPSDCDPTIV